MASFGANISSANYSIEKDFNEDGAMEILDMSLLMANYQKMRTIE